MRLVLDTDVLVSGLRSRVGASRVLLLAVEAEAVTPLVSVATVMEYEAVLPRCVHLRATGLSAGEVVSFLDDFVRLAARVTPYFRSRPSVTDANDEMFAELALNGSADALVSFNLRDYRPTDRAAAPQPFAICRPGDILRRLAWRPPATSLSVFPRR